jgi:hypothetical protein
MNKQRNNPETLKCLYDLLKCAGRQQEPPFEVDEVRVLRPRDYPEHLDIHDTAAIADTWRDDFGD